MKLSTATGVLAAFVGVASAVPQGVTGIIAPQSKAPAGCASGMTGKFQVTLVDLAKRDLESPFGKRDTCGDPATLVLTLTDGVLKDAHGRSGYVASNFQFQFDAPPQSGAIYTAGFSVCTNGSLALGGSAVWYACKSGTFYNLYDRHWAEQCQAVHVAAIPCGAPGSVGQIPDGQVVGTTLVATTVVTVLPDGQPQAVPTVVPVPICQIPDGQVQHRTTPCAAVPVPVATPIGKPIPQSPNGSILVPPPTAIAQPPAANTGAPAPPGGSAPGPAPTGSGPRPSAPTSAAPRPPQASAPPAAASAGRIASSSLGALVIGVFVAVLAF